MNEKIKIIIADDNTTLSGHIEKFLEKYEEIEILGIASTDEEEIKMIEELKPEIVITDLMRNHKYTGLDIIKEYQNKEKSPKFLVISALEDINMIRYSVSVAGVIVKKPLLDYELILKELKRIKKDITENKSLENISAINVSTTKLSKKPSIIEKILNKIRSFYR